MNQARQRLVSYLVPRVERVLAAFPILNQIRGLRQRLSQFEETIQAETQANAELIEILGRLIENLPKEADPDRTFRSLVGAETTELTKAAADFLNYSSSHRGFAAQHGLWFNPPLGVEYREGAVEANNFNERIVEAPYVFGWVCRLPLGSRVLDIGAAESLVAISLASLGYDTTAIDLSGYPLQHPRLTVIASDVASWPGPLRPFDAVVALSSIEHFGLSSYGSVPHDNDFDRQVVRRVASWLSTSGLLVFTAPWGKWSVSGFQRVYDDAHLEKLMDGWEILDRRYAVHTAPLRWEVVESPPKLPDSATHGVVMLVARPKP